MSYTPWHTAEVPGPKKGIPLLRPETLLSILKKANHPILIVGHRAVEIEVGNRKIIDYIIDFVENSRMPVIATAHTINDFIKRDFNTAISMSAMDVANRLSDPNWKGLDGTGQYDLALFVGIPYQMQWLILSGLKNSKLRTINIDGYFQPNASWSTPNLSPLELKEFFDALLEKFGEK
ncbi:MAG: CO dehydrogenase/acetyl-CoA synthase complex subunit epsilon [Candidatus Bathyarchaeota archaeon]|nr:CO dehydrogenase/acetyl-CoA synthase complex subunit epsilon [Candidatus Bathyarchaeota archaeon]